MDWRHRSACLDEDPELFFPIGNTGPAILQIEEAKLVCRRCDVREQCLEWAITSGQDLAATGEASARNPQHEEHTSDTARHEGPRFF